MRTPLVEPTDLFVRSIGEATDIVEKEMYTFEDKGEKMRDPLARLFKPRERSTQEKNRKRRTAQNKKKKLSKNQRTAKKKAESGNHEAPLVPGEGSTEELDGETYKRRKLSGTAPRFETIYVPAVPNMQKEQVGGEITPTEPCELESSEPFKDVPSRGRGRSSNN